MAAEPKSSPSACAPATRFALTHASVIAWSRAVEPELGDCGPAVEVMRAGRIPDEFDAGAGGEWFDTPQRGPASVRQRCGKENLF